MGIKSKNLYDKIRRNNPYFEDFITRSIYNSNAIEGNTLSYYDTYAIVFNDNTIVSAKPRELYEAINLKYALNYILKTLDNNLSIDMIKKIGIYINKNIDEISGFRQGQVYIRGTSYIPPSPSDVPRLVSELVYSTKKSNYNSIYDYLADFHLRFERIHPFSDGNGRTGRVLITKLCLQSSIAPIVVPLECRSLYMNLLDLQDVNGLSRMFHELSESEKNRMIQFGIVV